MEVNDTILTLAGLGALGIGGYFLYKYAMGDDSSDAQSQLDAINAANEAARKALIAEETKTCNGKLQAWDATIADVRSRIKGGNTDRDALGSDLAKVRNQIGFINTGTVDSYCKDVITDWAGRTSTQLSDITSLLGTVDQKNLDSCNQVTNYYLAAQGNALGQMGKKESMYGRGDIEYFADSLNKILNSRQCSANQDQLFKTWSWFRDNANNFPERGGCNKLFPVAYNNFQWWRGGNITYNQWLDIWNNQVLPLADSCMGFVNFSDQKYTTGQVFNCAKTGDISLGDSFDEAGKCSGGEDWRTRWIVDPTLIDVKYRI